MAYGRRSRQLCPSCLRGNRHPAHQPQGVAERDQPRNRDQPRPRLAQARRWPAQRRAAPAQTRASRPRCAWTSPGPCDRRTPRAPAPRPADETRRRRVRRSAESPPASARCVAVPIALRTTTDRIGPPISSTRGRQRSASVPKPELRHRAGQLVAHRQHADRLERQTQLRNQQRQQRRVHVAVGIDDEVRRRRGPDRGVQAEPLQRLNLRKRPSTMSRALVKLAQAKQRRSRGQDSRARRQSPPRAAPPARGIDVSGKQIRAAQPPHTRPPPPWPAAAVSTFTNVTVTRRPSMPCELTPQQHHLNRGVDDGRERRARAPARHIPSRGRERRSARC